VKHNALNIKRRMAAALAAGLLGASAASAAPLLNLQVLESSTGAAGSYSPSIPGVSSGGTIYFEVVAQSAASGSTNANTAQSPNGSTDSLGDLPTFTLTAESGTFGSSTLDFTGFFGAGIVNVGNNLLQVKAASFSFASTDTPLVLVNGTLTAGSGINALLATNNIATGDAGTFKVAGTAVGINASTETSADPLLSWASLTSGLVWSGTTNGNWDTATANFSGQTFSNASNVDFGDKASDNATNVQNTGALTIPSAGVSPNVVTFYNKAVTYNLSTPGTVGIGGSANVFIGGGGTVIFNSPNTYSGGTTIANGTLQAVAGSLPGQVTIGAAGKLAVGNGTVLNPSSLTTGPETWTAGGIYAPKLDPGNSADLLNINGNLTLAGAGAFQIDATAGDTQLSSTVSESWEIANITGSLAGYTGPTPTAGGANPGSQFVLTVPSSLFSNDTPNGVFSLLLEQVGAGHEELFAQYTPAPEPETAVLAISAVTPLLLARRRRTN
jgi:fibronectin-binding autotransporter adhesin